MKNTENLVPKIQAILRKGGDWMTIKDVAKELKVNVMYASGYLSAMHNLKQIDYKQTGAVKLYRSK